MGKCRYSDPQTGALFLAPHSNMQRLALVLLGNSLEGLKDVVSFAAPTIPPMTRSPVCTVAFTLPVLCINDSERVLCSSIYIAPLLDALYPFYAWDSDLGHRGEKPMC